MIPRLRSLSTRCFTGWDTEDLGRHADWTFHLQLLVLGTRDQVRAHFLEALHIPGRECDPNAMHFDLLGDRFTTLLVVRCHFASIGVKTSSGRVSPVNQR